MTRLRPLVPLSPAESGIPVKTPASDGPQPERVTQPPSQASEGQREVYALLDAAGVVRYVGQSADSQARVTRHWADARRYPEDERPHVAWLRSLVGPPAVKVLDRVSVGDADEAEAAWIRKLRRDPAAALFNLRPYELLDGLPGVDPAAVARLPVSLARTMTTEHRAAISSALRGHPVSVETRRRISEAKAGQPHTPAHRAAIAAGVRRALAQQPGTSSAS